MRASRHGLGSIVLVTTLGCWASSGPGPGPDASVPAPDAGQDRAACDDPESSSVEPQRTWSIDSFDTFDADGAEEAAVGVDSSGTIHVAYQTGFNEFRGDVGLFYARPYEPAWTWRSIDLIPTEVGATAPTVMVIDSTDQVHLAYLGERGIQYAASSGQEWATEAAVPGGDVWHIAMAAEDDGTIHLAYCGGYSGVWHGWRTAGAWQTEQLHEGQRDTTTSVGIDEDCGVAILVGADSQVHLAYTDGTLLHHAVEREDGWSVAIPFPAETIAGHLSASLDRDGTVNIAYREITSRELRLARGVDGQWESERVAALPEWGEQSVLSAPEGPVVLYGSGSQHRAFLATRVGCAWMEEEIVGLPCVDGVFLGPDGVLHASCGGSAVHVAHGTPLSR